MTSAIHELVWNYTLGFCILWITSLKINSFRFVNKYEHENCCFFSLTNAIKIHKCKKWHAIPVKCCNILDIYSDLSHMGAKDTCPKHVQQRSGCHNFIWCKKQQTVQPYSVQSWSYIHILTIILPSVGWEGCVKCQLQSLCNLYEEMIGTSSS